MTLPFEFSNTDALVFKATGGGGNTVILIGARLELPLAFDA